MKKLIYAAMVTALLGLASCYQTTNNNQKPNGKETEITDNTTDNNQNNGKPDDGKKNDNQNNNNNDNKKKDDDKNSFKSEEGRFSIDFPMPPAGPTKTPTPPRLELLRMFSTSTPKAKKAATLSLTPTILLVMLPTPT